MCSIRNTVSFGKKKLDKRGRNSHGGGNNWHNRHHHNDHHNGSSYHNQPNVNDDDILLTFKVGVGNFQPFLHAIFKAWVMKQDDNINEDDACKNFKVGRLVVIIFQTFIS